MTMQSCWWNDNSQKIHYHDQMDRIKRIWYLSPMRAVNQEEPSDRKPDPWPLWMAGHAQLKFVMTECSKTQIRLTGLKYCWYTYHNHKIKHIMRVVWPWSVQQHAVTMTWYCFDWKQTIDRETETIVRILLLHIVFNFHAHNYILSCFKYIWQRNDSGHESRAHVYDCSPWSKVCWSWWPQSKAWLTMVS